MGVTEMQKALGPFSPLHLHQYFSESKVWLRKVWPWGRGQSGAHSWFVLARDLVNTGAALCPWSSLHLVPLLLADLDTLVFSSWGWSHARHVLA